MQCVGRVGSGIDEELHGKLLSQLHAIRCPSPAIPTDIAGVWVGVFNPDPELPATYEVAIAVRPPGGSVRKSSPFAPPGRGR